VFSKGARHQRLNTVELMHMAFDGADATLLAAWLQLMVEALGALGPAHRRCRCLLVYCDTFT
jgi:hypothetical protein